MNTEAIRDELRDGSSLSLRRRRRIAALAAAGAVDFAIISLYQLGVIRHLPDPPANIFDSDKVNASTSAYRFGLPDGPLGLGQYGLALMLAGVGGSERTGRHPVFDLALAGVVTAGIAGAASYLYEMVRYQKRACAYCLIGAGLNFAMAPFAAGLVRSALRAWRRRS